MDSLAALIGVTALVFIALKFTFWANALILLSLMQRRIRKKFWRFSLIEVAIGLISSMSFSYGIIMNDNRLLVAIIFTVSTLGYLAYSIRRVWRLSEKRENP